MKITDLIISPESLGNKFWMADVIPSYVYKDGKRTDEISGYRYSVCLPERGLEKVNVRIDGKKVMEKPENGFVDVRFDNLEVYIYWLAGKPEVGARATGITLANPKG